MPVYEYQCNACGHAFEEWQKITEAAIKTCPSCAKDAVERLISQTAFMLKGGGWYKDLYSSGKAKPDSKSDSGSKESSADSGDKGTAKAADKSGGGGDKGGGGGDKGGGSGGGEKKVTESKSSDSSKGGGSTPSSGGSKSSAATAS